MYLYKRDIIQVNVYTRNDVYILTSSQQCMVTWYPKYLNIWSRDVAEYLLIVNILPFTNLDINPIDDTGLLLEGNFPLVGNVSSLYINQYKEMKVIANLA